MQNNYEKEQPILPSLCDYNAELSLSNTAKLFMDMAMYHAEMLGIGFTGFKERGLFWVAVKTKIKVFRKAKMATMVKISTWPEEAGTVRCNRDYEISDEEGVMAIGKTEWGVIDANTHLPQKTKDVYPADLVVLEKKCYPEPFAKLTGNFEGELIGTYTVRSVDTDYGRHMNNTAYISAIEGLFDSEELSKKAFSELEIHYKSPCFEGETISFYGIENDGYLEIKAVNKEDKIIVLARLK
jgi:acyl-ACP thioesterase